MCVRHLIYFYTFIQTPSELKKGASGSKEDIYISIYRYLYKYLLLKLFIYKYLPLIFPLSPPFCSFVHLFICSYLLTGAKIWILFEISNFLRIICKFEDFFVSLQCFVESLNLFIPNWRKIWKDL